jgi:DNA primase
LAGLIPEEKIREIKNASDIVDVVSEVVVLKKAGKNFLGLCPFHAEKTPSFTVSPEKQIFYCFGCSEGGNVFSFMMKHFGLSFPETAKDLARRYGINIPSGSMSPEQRKRLAERETLLGINRLAMEFYHNCLITGPGGKRSSFYMQERGIPPELIGKFKLGYAPDGWDNLLKHLAKKGISAPLAQKVGLVVPRKGKSGHYDRFRERIIFPIFDLSQQIIGFGGRVLDDSLPKYLNSPETPVYNKSRSLYGLNRAKQKCRATETVFIVEGYFDLLALHQHGIENSVATLGTSLTDAHVQVLKGFVGADGQAVLVYDSDVAGIKAAHRSIPVFDRGFMSARILVLPAGYDPDSFIFEFGPEAFLKASSDAPGIISFLIDSAVKKHGLSVEGKIKIIADLNQPLVSVGDTVARSLYVKELAERISIDESAILEKLRTFSGKNSRSVKPFRAFSANGAGYADSGSVGEIREKRKAAEKPGSRLERRITAMMLQYPDILVEIKRRNLIERFEDPSLKTICRTILELDRSVIKETSEVIARIGERENQNIAASLCISDEKWPHAECIKLLSQFESSKNRRNGDLLQQIREAEKNNDHGLLIKLLNERQVQVRNRQEDSTARS